MNMLISSSIIGNFLNSAVSVSFSRMTLLHLVIYNSNYIVMINVINPKKAKIRENQHRRTSSNILKSTLFFISIYL
jgi:hypothetical protein